MPERGWLKAVLEQAVADRETWPAWQRGVEANTPEGDTTTKVAGSTPLPDRGWLKAVLEQAVADRATWPAWQRGLEPADGLELEATSNSEVQLSNEEEEDPAA